MGGGVILIPDNNNKKEEEVTLCPFYEFLEDCSLPHSLFPSLLSPLIWSGKDHLLHGSTGASLQGARQEGQTGEVIIAG